MQRSGRSLQIYNREAFQAELNGICGSFDVFCDESLSGHLSVGQVGGLDIARVGLNADAVKRTTWNIRRDPGNHFFLILQQEGYSQLSQSGVSAQIQPGDMFVVDSTKECQFSYEGNYSLQLSVHLPRDEMCHRFGKRINGGMAIEGRDPLAIAMKAVLTKLHSTEDTRLQLQTAEAFYSVFGALLSERALGNDGRLSPDRQLVQSAMVLIAEHYSSPEFNSQKLADLLGISLRRLQRAFKPTGETPRDRLQRYRVEAVRQSIQSSSANQHSITTTSLAFACGFSDLSTFYRHYRKRYGCTPSCEQGSAAT